MDKRERIEDTTKYGEFVCTSHHWLSLDEQKRKVKKMENITNSEKSEDNKRK